VDNAFLHENLNEEVFMTAPPRLNTIKTGKVYKLTKSLYGVKQASPQWFAKLSSFLISIRYIQSKSDYSLFTHKNSTTFTTSFVYVDDVILVGNSMNQIEKTKILLHKALKIKKKS